MIIKLNYNNLSLPHLEHIAELLNNDGVIAYPTDTLFGIGCLISRKKAVDRIRAIKGSSVDKPMSILCSDMSMLSQYVKYLDTPTISLLKEMFPGPYTAVLPCNARVPLYLQKNQLVGIRIPEHRFCNAITSILGEPIITTSCNISGKYPSLSAMGIDDSIGHLLDLVVDCGSLIGLASTVVNLTTDKPILLRKGAGRWPLDVEIK